MTRSCGIRIALSLTCLLLTPGCHLLVRLGEEPTEWEQYDTPSAPEAGTDTDDYRPAPGLPPGTDSRPVPGLQPSTGDDRPVPGLRSDFDDDRPASARLRETDDERALARETERDLFALRRRLNSNTGINTDSAIAPGEGQIVYRAQLRFLQSHSSPAPVDRDVNVLVNPHILVYGLREDFSIFSVVPIVTREGTARPPAPPGTFTSLDEAGVADLRFFGKYRFCENDALGETTRWSVLGGIEVPSYDEPFTSDSWDPFIGTVWTYQSLQWGLDLDAIWQFNTGDGFFRHDTLVYDLAYTYVLLTGATLDDKVWQLNSIFEINGSYITEGSHLVFASPGFQLIQEGIIVEASLQLPAIRDLKTPLEPDFNLVIGTRISW